MITKKVSLMKGIVYECTGCGRTFSNLDDFLNHSC